MVSLLGTSLVPKVVRIRSLADSLFSQLTRISHNSDNLLACSESLAMVFEHWDGNILFLTRHDVDKAHQLLAGLRGTTNGPMAYFLYALEFLLLKSVLPLAPPTVNTYIEISRHSEHRAAQLLLDGIENDVEFLAILTTSALERLYLARGHIHARRLLFVLGQVPGLLDKKLTLDFLLSSIVFEPRLDDIQLFSFCLDQLHNELGASIEYFMEPIWRELLRLPFAIEYGGSGDWNHLGAFNVYFRRIFTHDPRLLHKRYYDPSSELTTDGQAAIVANSLRLLHLLTDNYEDEDETTLVAQIKELDGGHTARIIQVIDYYLSVMHYDYWTESTPGLQSIYRVLLTAFGQLADGPGLVEQYLAERDYWCLLQFWLVQHPGSAWPIVSESRHLSMAAFAILLRHLGRGHAQDQTEYITGRKLLQVIEDNYRLATEEEAPSELLLFDSTGSETGSTDSTSQDTQSPIVTLTIPRIVVLRYELAKLLKLLRSLAYVVLDVPFYISSFEPGELSSVETFDAQELVQYAQNWVDQLSGGQYVRVKLIFK